MLEQLFPVLESSQPNNHASQLAPDHCPLVLVERGGGYGRDSNSEFAEPPNGSSAILPVIHLRANARRRIYCQASEPGFWRQWCALHSVFIHLKLTFSSLVQGPLQFQEEGFTRRRSRSFRTSCFTSLQINNRPDYLRSDTR